MTFYGRYWMEIPLMDKLPDIVYLACPYASRHKELRDIRLTLVTEMAGLLMNTGQVIFSPLTHNAPISKAFELPNGWDFWSQIDLAFLSHCSHLLVLTLPGWKESTGVQAEIKAARAQGIPISYLTYPDLEARKAP